MQTETEIQKLIALIKDKNWVVQRSAMQALGNLGAKEAIPYLIDIIKDPDNYVYVRSKAAEALGQLGAKEAITYLIPLLKDPDNYVCISAKQALDELG